MSTNIPVCIGRRTDPTGNRKLQTVAIAMVRNDNTHSSVEENISGCARAPCALDQLPANTGMNFDIYDAFIDKFAAKIPTAEGLKSGTPTDTATVNQVMSQKSTVLKKKKTLVTKLKHGNKSNSASGVMIKTKTTGSKLTSPTVSVKTSESVDENGNVTTLDVSVEKIQKLKTKQKKVPKKKNKSEHDKTWKEFVNAKTTSIHIAENGPNAQKENSKRNTTSKVIKQKTKRKLSNSSFSISLDSPSFSGSTDSVFSYSSSVSSSKSRCTSSSRDRHRHSKSFRNTRCGEQFRHRRSYSRNRYKRNRSYSKGSHLSYYSNGRFQTDRSSYSDHRHGEHSHSRDWYYRSGSDERSVQRETRFSSKRYSTDDRSFSFTSSDNFSSLSSSSYSEERSPGRYSYREESAMHENCQFYPGRYNRYTRRSYRDSYYSNQQYTSHGQHFPDHSVTSRSYSYSRSHSNDSFSSSFSEYCSSCDTYRSHSPKPCERSQKRRCYSVCSSRSSSARSERSHGSSSPGLERKLNSQSQVADNLSPFQRENEDEDKTKVNKTYKKYLSGMITRNKLNPEANIPKKQFSNNISEKSDNLKISENVIRASEKLSAKHINKSRNKTETIGLETIILISDVESEPDVDNCRSHTGNKSRGMSKTEGTNNCKQNTTKDTLRASENNTRKNKCVTKRIVNKKFHIKRKDACVVVKTTRKNIHKALNRKKNTTDITVQRVSNKTETDSEQNTIKTHALIKGNRVNNGLNQIQHTTLEISNTEPKPSEIFREKTKAELFIYLTEIGQLLQNIWREHFLHRW